jgi:uncharacterized membrane protein
MRKLDRSQPFACTGSWTDQLVYPILLSTILALALFAGRVYLSRTFSHSNLVWNLFLAWVPFVCSFLAAITYYSAWPR